LDTGNVKSALTQCNKLLKKYPTPASGTAVQSTPANVTRQLLTALKILALVRANKLDEASTLTTTLLAETPTDETVLSTLAHSLKPLDRPKELVGMWVNAWGRATKDAEEFKKKNKPKQGSKPVDAQYAELQQRAEELGAQAFMSMVRTGHWVTAQSTAFKLYRTFAPPKGTEGAQSEFLFLANFD
jgi:N-terminal acetyltransferase B complex non-catalytic subunit